MEKHYKPVSAPVPPYILIRDKYLSEFKTEYEKALARKNLGISGSGLDIDSLDSDKILYDNTKSNYSNNTIGKAMYNAETNISALMAKTFPLTASYATKRGFGTFEVGTSTTPKVTLSVIRQDSEVTPDTIIVTPDGTISEDKKEVTWAATTSAGTYKVSVSLNGLTVDLDSLSVAYTNYRYCGLIDSEPTDYPTAIKALSTKELTTTSTLGSTSLTAGKCYLFAVKGTPTLVCRHASTDGIISGCTTGTCSISQENDNTKLNIYSYIFIPASSSNWNFKITNS